MHDEPTKDFIKRMEDPEYAKLYGEEAAKVDFAITLTKARLSLNLTQKELAGKLGISQPYIAKLEGGEANPTLGAIGKLLAAVNLRLVTETASLVPEQEVKFYIAATDDIGNIDMTIIPGTTYNTADDTTTFKSSIVNKPYSDNTQSNTRDQTSILQEVKV